MIRGWRLAAVAGLAVLFAGRAEAQTAHVSRLRGDAWLVSTPAANALVLAPKEGAVVIGPAEPALVARTRALLDSLGVRPAMAVITPAESALVRGDGGWSRAGAISVSHEWIRNRARQGAAGTRPTIGFSEVIQLGTAGDEVHAVHQPSGYSDGDVSVHVEVRHFLYLGNLFTSDGYPAIDVAGGGSIGGIIRTAERFKAMFGESSPEVEPIVPGRGPVSSLKELAQFHDMLVAVRDRVALMARAGQPLDAIIRSKPTATFDARWGHGPVSADRFVTMVYESVRKGGGK